MPPGIIELSPEIFSDIDKFLSKESSLNRMATAKVRIIGTSIERSFAWSDIEAENYIQYLQLQKQLFASFLHREDPNMPEKQQQALYHIDKDTKKCFDSFYKAFESGVDESKLFLYEDMEKLHQGWRDASYYHKAVQDIWSIYPENSKRSFALLNDSNGEYSQWHKMASYDRAVLGIWINGYQQYTEKCFDSLIDKHYKNPKHIIAVASKLFPEGENIEYAVHSKIFDRYSEKLDELERLKYMLYFVKEKLLKPAYSIIKYYFFTKDPIREKLSNIKYIPKWGSLDSRPKSAKDLWNGHNKRYGLSAKVQYKDNGIKLVANIIDDREVIPRRLRVVAVGKKARRF